MELTVSTGPVSMNENEVTILFAAGFQALLGIDFEVSVTIPLFGGKK